MFWTTEPFVKALDIITQISDANEPEYSEYAVSLIQSLGPLVSNVKDDLTMFLDTPVKSEISRQELKKGIVTFGSEQFKINQEFIDESCLLADSLKIDELVAAQLIHNSSNDEKRLDMGLLECGVALFHVRRQYILDIIRFVLIKASEYQNSNAVEYSHYTKIIEIFLSPIFVTKCIDSMTKIEGSLVEVDEEENRGQFLGKTNSDSYLSNLKLRRDFLVREHENLGQILLGLVYHKSIKSTEFIKILSLMERLTTYNNLTIHYLPVVLAYSSCMDPLFSGNSAIKVSLDEAKQVYEALLSNQKKWSLDYLKGAVQNIFFTYYIGMYKSDDTNLLTSGIDYQSGLISSVRDSIDMGGLEFLLAVAADITLEAKSIRVPYYEFRSTLQERVPIITILGQGSFTKDFNMLLTSCLEAYTESFITNLADILKEMRLSEEDAILSSHEKYIKDEINNFPGRLNPRDNNEFVQGLDLERFFMFVSYLYLGRDDAALPFWQDTESNLHGFLTWASQCQVALMAATFNDMLASLSTGPQCAAAANKFLKEDHVIASNSLTRNSNTTRKSSKVSWQTISSALSYYIEQLSPRTPEPNSSSSFMGGKVMVQLSRIELDSEAVFIIASYLRLMSQIIENDPIARVELYNDKEFRFLNKIFNFLSFQTPLVGASLDLIRSFAASDNLQMKRQLWTGLDLWIFNTDFYTAEGKIIPANAPIRDRLNYMISSFSDVLGFINLLKDLILLPIGEGDKNKYMLPFPSDLGSAYRTPGVWPYCEFVINNVLYPSSSSSFSETQRLAIQIPCLLFIRHSLEFFDPNIYSRARAAGASVDNLFQTSSNLCFTEYVQIHPCSTLMNMIFNEKIYNTLLGIASVDIEKLSDLSNKDPIIELTLESLKVIDLVLKNQFVFLEIITPIMQQSVERKIDTVHTIESFEDAILYNIGIIPHLALYISLPNTELALTSLGLLAHLSESTQFTSKLNSNLSESRIKRSRLLSTFETVNDSIRIKIGIVEQLERDLSLYDTSCIDCGCTSQNLEPIALKLGILRFLVANLSATDNKEPTVAHFLLGFGIKGDGSLCANSELGGISSDASVLRSVMLLLQYSVGAVDSWNIDYNSSSIAGECSNVVSLLCKNSFSSSIMLDYLREIDFFHSSLENEPFIDPKARWNGEFFSTEASFFASLSPKSFTYFFNHRTALLEYLSMEIHASAQIGSISLVERYLKSLVNLNQSDNSYVTSTSTTRVLSFLDVLEFQPSLYTKNQLFDRYTLNLFSSLDLNYLSNMESKKNRKGTQVFDDSISEGLELLKSLLSIKADELVATKRVNSIEDPALVKESQDIVNVYSRFKLLEQIRQSQLSCLHAWSQLILIIVSDCEMTTAERSIFILEIFQAVIPKLSSYSSNDADFTEELASLLVPLFQMYQEDVQIIDGNSKGPNNGYERTHALFRACLTSIRTSVSTPQMRSDLYVLCNKYLKLSIESGSSELIQQNLQVVKSSGDKLLEIICLDAISGEGSARIVSLMLLETLSSLALISKSSFVLDGLTRYNLLLLLVGSIKNTDNQLVANQNSKASDELVYELTVFRATLYFLVQIARTRQGANQIIQCGLYQILSTCQFLNIDPDVGLHFEAELANQNNTGNLGISFKLGGFLSNEPEGANVHLSCQSIIALSYYDILIPVFQLVSAVLLSMGSENSTVIQKTSQFLLQHQQLIVSVLKKDVLSSSVDDSQKLIEPVQNKPKVNELGSDQGFESLVRLVVLLISLTGFVPEASI
ncbi:hypothetical protein NADFUDRAFT_42738 [Nadsonia fulvescens var. elongata DSM 6958]|uniref:Nucleoporin n=1 Tax=Nadsonia fulvescens var. elongata DSM 6958 TaxID=857566 RepID=A0A1E3PJ76_9ASCO|nr:hypothetical protein NADFUDRAFT_42738 [Nadsonia fulvescens var. elongata DSM 6958]